MNYSSWRPVTAMCYHALCFRVTSTSTLHFSSILIFLYPFHILRINFNPLDPPAYSVSQLWDGCGKGPPKAHPSPYATPPAPQKGMSVSFSRKTTSLWCVFLFVYRVWTAARVAFSTAVLLLLLLLLIQLLLTLDELIFTTGATYSRVKRPAKHRAPSQTHRHTHRLTTHVCCTL